MDFGLRFCHLVGAPESPVSVLLGEVAGWWRNGLTASHVAAEFRGVRWERDCAEATLGWNCPRRKRGSNWLQFWLQM